MAYKIYINLKDYPNFLDLENRRSYNRDKNSLLFSRIIDAINGVKDDDTIVILIGVEPFAYNLSDLQSMFDMLDDNGIKYTFATRLTTPVTKDKIDIAKRCHIDTFKRAIYMTFDYKELICNNTLKDWASRLRSFEDNRIKCIPLVVLSRQLIERVKPTSLIAFFKKLNVNLIEFWFVKQSNLDLLPDNDKLVDWLTECYKVYKEENKGKQTYEKFQIRAFNRMKSAKNGLLKGLTTHTIFVSSTGGIIEKEGRKCTACENCKFADYYRNKENIPIFRNTKHCFMRIFETK